jgi:hypothetical protein
MNLPKGLLDERSYWDTFAKYLPVIAFPRLVYLPTIRICPHVSHFPAGRAYRSRWNARCLGLINKHTRAFRLICEKSEMSDVCTSTPCTRLGTFSVLRSS